MINLSPDRDEEARKEIDYLTKALENARIEWSDRVKALKERLGREPKLEELIEECKQHVMTEQEKAAQKESFVRAFSTPCEHGWLDFEDCPQCRGAYERRKA